MKFKNQGEERKGSTKSFNLNFSFKLRLVTKLE